MMPHVHILIGIGIANLLSNSGSFTINDIIWFVIGSVFPDLDFILGLLIGINHRQLPTHLPIIYVVGLFLTFFLYFPLFWLFFGGLIHVLFDFCDWGVYLFAPFSMRSFSLIKLNYEELIRNGFFYSFFKSYYRNRSILALEISIIIGSLLIMLIHF